MLLSSISDIGEHIHKKERFMARIPRIMITGEPTAYHIMSRTALEGYPMDDVDKDFFLSQVVKLSKLYFVEVMGFAVWETIFICW